MLNTKEYCNQLEMDTIQQEPLFTELTPEAAATVEGGVLYTTRGVTTRLNIRPTASTRFNPIDSFPRGAIFDATVRITNGFRKLIGRTGWVSARFTRRYRP